MWIENQNKMREIQNVKRENQNGKRENKNVERKSNIESEANERIGRVSGSLCR